MSPSHLTRWDASEYASDYASFNLPELALLQGNPTVMDISQCFLGNTSTPLSIASSPSSNNMGTQFAFNDPSQFQAVKSLHSQHVSGSTAQNLNCINSIYEVDQRTTDGEVERTSSHNVHEKCEMDCAEAFSTEISGSDYVKPRDGLCTEDGGTRSHAPELRCRWEGCRYAGTFGRETDLLRHLKSVHICRDIHFCSAAGCQKWFNRRDNMKEHIRRVHRDDSGAANRHSS